MTATQDLRRRVQRAVDELGLTALDMADGLRARGIKGERENALDCPLARAIRAAVPELARVIVGDGYAYIRTTDWLHGGIDIKLPPAAGQFVREFDAGVHLDLVAPVVIDR